MRILPLGFVFIAACKTTSPSKPAEVSKSSPALLGRTIDLDDPSPGKTSCLEMNALTDADLLFIPPKRGQASYEFGVQIEGNSAFKLNAPELAYGSDGLLSFSSDAQAMIRLEGTAADVTLTSLQFVEAGVYRVKPQSIPGLRFTSDAAALVAQVKSAPTDSARQTAWKAFREKCGTHFVSGYSLGNTMAASLHYTFHDETEALRYTPLILNDELETKDQLIPWTFSPYTRYISLARKRTGFNPEDYGDVEELVCPAESRKPCLERLKNFHENVLPAYGKWLSSLSDKAEKLLPVSVLESPEYQSYSAIDPDLSLTLAPDRVSEWSDPRKKFKDALRRNIKDQFRIQTLGFASKAGYEPELAKLQDEKRRISELAKPCFEDGSLDFVLCKEQGDRLPDVTEPLKSLYREVPGFLPICKRFKAVSFHQDDPTLSSILLSSEEYQSMSVIFAHPVIKQSLTEKIPSASGNFDAFAVSAEVWGPRHPSFDCAVIDEVFRDITGTLQFEGRLKEVGSLAGFLSISELNLSNQRIRGDLSALGRLPRLETLSLTNNRLNELDGILNLKQLKVLDLSENRLISVQVLQAFFEIYKRAKQPILVKAKNVDSCNDTLLSEYRNPASQIRLDCQ